MEQCIGFLQAWIENSPFRLNAYLLACDNYRTGDAIIITAKTIVGMIQLEWEAVLPCDSNSSEDVQGGQTFTKNSDCGIS